MLRDHWNLDPDNSLNERVQVAAIMCAYNNATTRSQRAAEVEAEYDTKEWIKPLVAGEWQSMKGALERRVGRLEDKVMPAKEYVEKKLAELENGEFRAETLAEVISRDEVDPDGMVPVWDSKGRVTLRKGSTKISDPANAEALRRRLTVLKNCYVMISLRHTNRPEWQGDHAEIIEQYKDYLLGDYCNNLLATDQDGNTAPLHNTSCALLQASSPSSTAKDGGTTTRFPKGQRQDQAAGKGKGPCLCLTYTSRGTHMLQVQHEEWTLPTAEVQVPTCLRTVLLWQAPNVCLQCAGQARPSKGHPRFGCRILKGAQSALYLRWKAKAEFSGFLS